MRFSDPLRNEFGGYTNAQASLATCATFKRRPPYFDPDGGHQAGVARSEDQRADD